MNNKVKILCVGIGGYANVYLQGLLFQENPEFEIVGAVDVYPESAKFYNEIVARNIPIYKDMKDFYADGGKADLAIIATPIHFHTRQILTEIGRAHV